MPTSYTIGTEQRKTWAALRAPLFNGPGFSTPSMPGASDSENWNKSYPEDPDSGSAGYPNALTDLRKAYPFRQVEGQEGGPAKCYSTALGCNQRIIPESGGEERLEYYLAIGEGIYDLANLPTPLDNVFDGYSTTPEEGIGYDFISTRDHLFLAVVNVTVYDIDGSAHTLDVDIFYSLFSWHPFVSGPAREGGQAFFVTEKYPQNDPPPDVRPTPWWVINSVTLAP